MLQLRNKSSAKGPLWLVEKKYTLGSDSASDVKIISDGVHANHAELLIHGDVIRLINLVGGTELSINGQTVSDKAELRPGDVLKLGGEELELVDPKASTPSQKAPENVNRGWALKALNTALADKHFPLSGIHNIGRSQECEICLGVVHLSRKHAKITVTDSGLNIEDLNSSNGTYVNGKKIDQITAIAGDEISFDTLRFRVIGPIIDEDKTTVRPSSDGDLTTIRPAVQIPGGQVPHKASHGKPKSKHRSGAAGSKSSKSLKPASKAASKPIAAEESKSSGMAFAGIAVLLGAAVAWFFLK